MKKILFLFALGFLGSMFLHAQNRITVELEDFNSLIVSGRIQVELIPGDKSAMSITAKNNLPEDLNFELSGKELKLKIRPGINKEIEYFVKLHYQSLSMIEAGAGAYIYSGDSIKNNDLELRAHTGGKIEAAIRANHLKAKVTEGSDIVLYGRTRTQNISANTGGNYLAYALDCDDTYVKTLAGAQAKVKAKNLLDANAQTKGFIGYLGSPETTYFKTSLGGMIQPFKNEREAEAY